MARGRSTAERLPARPARPDAVRPGRPDPGGRPRHRPDDRRPGQRRARRRSRSPASPKPAAAEPLTAGQLHAAGLLVAVLGRLVDRYRAEADPAAIVAADAWLRERLGNVPTNVAVASFAAEFPARLAIPERPEPSTAIAQLLLLASLDENAAVDPFRELVDLRAVREGRALVEIADELDHFFATRPGFGPDGRSLVELLRQPATAAPGSLADQLRWIREHWAGLFGGIIDDLLDRLLVALDVLAEEKMAADRAWFAAHDTGAGGPAEVYHYDLGEEERFSEDRDWMPRLVLIAKSTYVWLDQLSRRYGREIRTLDAIPDEELDTLARRGITGLWLIGLWERSDRVRADQAPARRPGRRGLGLLARRLRHRRRPGRTRAPWPSCADGRPRAGSGSPATWSRTTWGSTRAGWSTSPTGSSACPSSPFPAYSFDGPDLSSTTRGSGSSSRTTTTTRPTRPSSSSGSTAGPARPRYVYHGNDGTSFPWNDTAQLDYSRADVREAVIQTILDVARQFPIIRFDAAMVLAKKHVQRLWFPEPGHGGAIPSRAGHGMTRAEFDRAMPREFWREVVDRVAAEVPGRSCWPRRSGSSRATSCGPSACTASTTARS